MHFCNRTGYWCQKNDAKKSSDVPSPSEVLVDAENVQLSVFLLVADSSSSELIKFRFKTSC